MKAIYDVNRDGYGTGWDLTLEEANKNQAKRGGKVVVSTDGGKTWTSAN